MGLLWGRKKKNVDAKEGDTTKAREAEKAGATSTISTTGGSVGGVQRNESVAAETSVFEFGSAGVENVTLAGYCPISDSLEPCRWEILPSGGEAPKFRIIF